METDLTPCMAIRAPLGDACMAMGTNGTWKGLVLLGDAAHGHLLGHSERESQRLDFQSDLDNAVPSLPGNAPSPIFQSINRASAPPPYLPPAVEGPPPCRRVQHLPTVPNGRGEAGQVRLHQRGDGGIRPFMLFGCSMIHRPIGGSPLEECVCRLQIR